MGSDFPPRNINDNPPILTGDRPLPHNDEAEVAVLGAMLLDPDSALDYAVTRLNFESSFYNPANQAIFTGITKLSSQDNRGKIDLITLSEALAADGKLEEVGGRTYLMRVMNSVPTAANIEQYTDIVHHNAVLRKLIATSVDVMSRCYDTTEDIKELLDTVERKVLEVTNLDTENSTKCVSELVLGAVNYLDSLHRNEQGALGLATGYPDLDKLITGLKPAEMFVLAARPSIGKTAFALNLALNCCMYNEDAPVGIFSLEMSASLLVIRLLCSLARVNLGDIREGSLSAGRWQEIMECGQKLRSLPIVIDDTSNIDVVELRAKARRMHREHGIKLLVIDYLQLMKAAGNNKNATRENEVAYMSSGIKSLAKELEIPIIILAQLNRQAEQPGQQPKLSHLRESGAIEQDADLVALLHRDRGIDGGGTISMDAIDAELIIAKHRNGPTGVVPLTFIPQYVCFESRSPVADEDVPNV